MEEENQKQGWGSVGVFVAFLWVMLGVLGFLTSAVCFAYNGTFMQNWVGLLTAITMGPFYWFYFAMVGDGYCSGKPSLGRKGGKKGGRRSVGGRRRSMM